MAKSYPKTHMLKSMVHADLPEGPLSALNEFIDNSLGASAGNAKNVRIIYQSDKLVILDDGQGVHDLNALFTIGDSQSRLSDADIGNFGWGSKVGALYLGWTVTAETVRDDRYHINSVDFEHVCNSGEWHDDYEGKGSKPSKKTLLKGTRITIGKRHRRFSTKPMAEKLAFIYAPALRNGREIRLTQFKDNGEPLHDVKLSTLVDKIKLDNAVEFSVSIPDGKTGEPKTAYIKAGALVERKARLNGVHIAFGHRVIRTETRLRKSLPSKLYVDVQLDKSWKQSLTATKNDVRFDKEELMGAIEDGIGELIELLNTEMKERRVEFLNAQISQAFNESIAALNDDPGMFEAMRKAVTKRGIRGKADKSAKPSDGPNDKDETKGKFEPGDNNDADERKERKQPYGLKFNIEPLGEEQVFRIDPSDSELCVSLNSDIESLEKAYAAPVQGFAIWSNAVHSLTHWFFERNTDRAEVLAKLLPMYRQAIEDNGGTLFEELRHLVLTKLLDCAPELREPTPADYED